MARMLAVLFATLRALAVFVWRIVGPLLGVVAQILLALLVLFEEWGWRPLSDALARLSRFRPIARLELAIAGLPPYAALVTIALPSALLFPLKFVAVWLVANGYFVGAAALFVGAKIASTALIARVFLLVRPALMRIAWFKALHDRFVPWKEAIFARIRASWVWRYGRMLKTAVRLEAKQAWERWRPRLRTALDNTRVWAAVQWRTLRTRALRTWQRILGDNQP